MRDRRDCWETDPRRERWHCAADSKLTNDKVSRGRRWAGERDEEKSMLSSACAGWLATSSTTEVDRGMQHVGLKRREGVIVNAGMHALGQQPRKWQRQAGGDAK